MPQVNGNDIPNSRTTSTRTNVQGPPPASFGGSAIRQFRSVVQPRRGWNPALIVLLLLTGAFFSARFINIPPVTSSLQSKARSAYVEVHDSISKIVPSASSGNSGNGSTTNQSIQQQPPENPIEKKAVKKERPRGKHHAKKTKKNRKSKKEITPQENGIINLVTEMKNSFRKGRWHE